VTGDSEANAASRAERPQDEPDHFFVRISARPIVTIQICDRMGIGPKLAQTAVPNRIRREEEHIVCIDESERTLLGEVSSATNTGTDHRQHRRFTGRLCRLILRLDDI
jgi:hypothetical protein